MRTEGTYEIHHVYKDHLGSWTTITNAGGVVEREQSFDAWGNMRDPETWSCDYNNTPMFDRGFTGHEHLHMFGLINMNGRMFDPTMSSFLSVDNFVQAPDFSQSFNRYSYCLNNPLKFVDPSGWQMVGGMKPNPFHENWSVSHVAPAHGPSAFVNPYNLLNMALYGNLYGPNEVVGGGGGSSMDALYGTYGHYVTHQANSVLNYTFPSTQLHLIRNWHNNPCRATNSDIRDAGITNVTVGEVNYGGGIRTSFYSWETASGQEKSASVWYESVGGNSKGTGALSLQPLDWYGNSDVRVAAGMLNIGGLYTAIESGLHYNKTLGFWRGKNGKFYGLDVNGNGYTGGKLKYGKTMSESFRRASGLFNAAGMLISASQFYTAESTDDKIKYGADVLFGGLGFAPGGGYISTFWFFGGRELVFQYGNTMGELIKDGFNPGYPVYQPFK